MYLSRMHLNPQRRKTREFLANPQMLHAAVLAAFPPTSENTAGDEGRILWRTEREKDTATLYVLSPLIPSFEHLQEQAGWSQHTTWETKDYAPLLERVSEGKEFAFRLTANPVHTVTTPSGKKRFAHVTVRQQQNWLLERAEVMGVSFPNDGVIVTGRERLSFNRRGSKVTLSRVTFDGQLRVENPDKFIQVLKHGLGKAKGYGCGLLTLAGV